MPESVGACCELKAFALTGVRCVRLEHGYLPQNHYHNELEPIYEDKITGPAHKPSGPRRSPSPISVLTNGSFFNSHDDKKKMAPGRYSTGSKRSMIRRSSTGDARVSSSRMLNDMMGQKYRRQSFPCLSSFKTSYRDIEEGLETEARSNSLESLVIDASRVTKSGSNVSAEVTSFTGRSSIYQGHIGSMTLSKYILDPTSKQDAIDTFRRPVSVENDTKLNILCLNEKKTSKRLFLVCFGLFVVMVILFLVSITSGWLFPGLIIERPQHYHVTPRTTHTDFSAEHNITGIF